MAGAAGPDSSFRQRCSSALTHPLNNRLRWGLLVVGVAVLVAVACRESAGGTTYTAESDPPTGYGVRELGVSSDGTVFASRDHQQAPREYHYVSHDGGLNWIEKSTDPTGITWNPGNEITPRGQYERRISGVVLTDVHGRFERVYSTAYLWKPGNRWVQEKTFGRVVPLPSDTVYEPHSGNLIIAMGRQGVVVGTSDGKWTRYAVGPISPLDFSFIGKTRLLISDVDFWVVALALALSMASVALIYAQHDPEGSKLLAATRILISGTSVVLSLAMLIQFGDSIASDVPSSFDRLAASAFTLGGAAVVSSLLPPRYWIKAGASYGGMIALVVLLFMLWLHVGLELGLAIPSTVVLTALGALTLGHHLRTAEYRSMSASAGSNPVDRWVARFSRRRTVESGPVLCRHCQRPNNPLAQDCHTCGLPLGQYAETR